MKKIIVLSFLLISAIFGNAQQIDKIITESEVERIERVLSADELMGRRIFTPGIDKAADFIAEEFRKAGLQPVNGQSFFQQFTMLRTRFVSASGEINGKAVEERNIVGFSSQAEISITNNSGYEKITIGPKDTLYTVVQKLLRAEKNYFVVVDSVHARLFNSLKRFRRESFPRKGNLLAVLSKEQANSYSIQFKQEVGEVGLKNVVGILPGKKRKDEYVIFSGHYDHIGVERPAKGQDSIFNGANDDASGITAVIQLASYYAQQKDNERTLVFAAFTAEEFGGYGSQHFSGQYDAKKVMAMFNIEMIGTESKWGTNSAFITGYEKTNMGEILQKNLTGSQFSFYPDPYPAQELFYRSDNATLARLGVPAHTISTSKMDSEKNYHTVEDEIETLNLKNMAEIIKSIALSAKSIVDGRDTPTRVDATKLR